MVRTGQGEYRGQAVVMAIGRRGTPRKLDVPGENLPHVMYSLLDAEAYRNRKIVVIGGGDSAIEAAMGLAIQPGNKVVISYRRNEFTRLKDRNEKRLEECLRDGSVKTIMSSQPVEITRDAVLLRVGDEDHRVPADYVWIFAGGTPPREFLEKIGIGFGRQDLTEAASRESRVS